MSKNRSNRRKKPIGEEQPTKYVCKLTDLDLLLDDTLKSKFQQLFASPEAWRMRYKGTDVARFLDRYGISLEHPTVRDAVAFDLVKLDDGSVSNDSQYTYDEHVKYSTHEYERFLLNKNYRINLVNLDTDWTQISYRIFEEEAKKDKRTVERMYQGVKVSNEVLRFFASIYEEWFGEDGHLNIYNIYVPFTNANDFYAETSLVPNTHPDFRPITARAYYDMKYIKYKKALKKWGIRAIATFALVDPEKDKNHTGWFRVKVQRKIEGLEKPYQYIVCDIDKDGKIALDENGNPDVHVFDSEYNTVLCVCTDDFKEDRIVPTRDFNNLNEDDFWHPEQEDEDGNTGIRDIPMVKSTTSSHYSIFRQRIPDYDLKQVRHYFQFKNRLAGMELCLEQLKRDQHRKEVQASECFAKLTMAIWRLMQEFGKNSELMKYVMKYYDLVAEYDELVVKKYQLVQMKDEKQTLLDSLVSEYNGLGGYQTSVDRNLDKKIELGSKIKSLRLELDKSIGNSIEAIDNRRHAICQEIECINDGIAKIQNPDEISIQESDKPALEAFLNKLNGNIDKWKSDRKVPTQDEIDDYLSKYDIDEQASSDKSQAIVGRIDEKNDSLNGSLDKINEEIQKDDTEKFGPRNIIVVQEDSIPQPVPIQNIDTNRLHHLILASERWRGFMFSLGYEANQMKKMLVKAEDATIKVRRLVRNFKDKMEEVEGQVWNEDHHLKNGFEFTGMTTSSIREIILLHDWYAANAPEKTYQEMGFSSADEFMQFRIACNKTSYNLRKNQYAEMIALRKDRLQRRMLKLADLKKDTNTLKWKDKYGWEAKHDEDEKKWSLSDVSIEQKNRIEELTKYDNPIHKILDRHLQDELDGKASQAKTSGGLGAWGLSDVTSQQRARVNPFASIEKILRKEEISSYQYNKDLNALERRTLDYLKDIGLIRQDSDIENLAVRVMSNNYQGDIVEEIGKLEEVKKRLDSAKNTMERQRSALQSIIDSVYSAESKVKELEDQNRKILDMCLVEKNKQIRNRLLIDKLENENKIVELKDSVREIKKKHLSRFKTLEKMRKQVDELQSELNQKISEFKDEIGLDAIQISRLMVGIYNRYQDEILEGEKK